MIKATSNKGFHMTFKNGWNISVQFGYGNYCDNGHHPEGLALHDKRIVESENAEIAIWDKNNVDYTFEDGYNVKGWLTADQVAEWIDKVSRW
jgi:hypothetical protein